MMVEIHAPEVVDAWKEMLWGYFKSQSEQGVVFKNEQIVQIGWMNFKLKSSGSKLMLTCPVRGKMPCEFIDDCSHGITTVMLQKFTNESFGCPMQSCTYAQSAIVLKGLKKEMGLFLNRSDPSEGKSSGWFVGAQRSGLNVKDPNNLELKSLWELTCMFPETLNFWLMDVNWQILFKDRPVILCDYKEVKPRPQSYYEAVLNSPIQ